LRNRVLGGFIGLAIILAAGSAWAHHSPSSIFDMNKPFTLSGTLTHCDLYRREKSGRQRSGKLEMGKRAASIFEARGRNERAIQKCCGPNGFGERVSREGWLALRIFDEDHVRGWDVARDGAAGRGWRTIGRSGGGDFRANRERRAKTDLLILGMTMIDDLGAEAGCTGSREGQRNSLAQQQKEGGI
jgi:hypothetical protein